MEIHEFRDVAIKSQADENRINLADFQRGFKLIRGRQKLHNITD
jgi:hypothetical protein